MLFRRIDDDIEVTWEFSGESSRASYDEFARAFVRLREAVREFIRSYVPELASHEGLVIEDDWETLGGSSPVNAPKGLKYSSIRDEVERAIRHLADREYQARRWVDPKPNFEDGRELYEDLATDLNLLDDLGLFDDPATAIGVFLWDQQEAEAVGAVTAALKAVLLECGKDAEDWALMESDTWPQVVEAAKVALSVWR